MSTTSARSSSRAGADEPAWDIVRLFPNQGHWSEQEYLDLTGNHLIEFHDGIVEVLEIPTPAHQRIVLFLYRLLFEFVSAGNLGEILVAPCPIRLWTGKFREPDVMLMLAANAASKEGKCWNGADLVIEVLSEDRGRDLEIKRAEYARAGISEYWIVDPERKEMNVLRLNGDQYAVHDQIQSNGLISSALLSGLSVDVASVFAAARQ